MERLDTPPTFENISKRVVYSYLRQLPQFIPFIPDDLSPDEQHSLQVSQNELHNFFQDFYQQTFDHPELFGLPIKQDAYMVPGYSKEEKQAVARQFKKPRVTIEHGIDFLYLAGKHGELVIGNIHLDNQDYDEFFTKNPRVKRKFLKGMENVGLTLSEQDGVFVVSNPQYPHMMLALKALAEACTHNTDVKMGKFLFSRCDFKAHDPEFQPSVMDMLRPVISPSSYDSALEIHQNLSEMSYTPTVNMGGIFEWRIQYQGNRKIKSTPFFEFEYDERQQDQLLIRVKCASTNRLVPLLQDQPALLQQDFYRHAHNCVGSSCGWCYTRKALEPSVIEHNGEKRTICWWMQRHFHTLDKEIVNLIKQYSLLHEDLLTA